MDMQHVSWNWKKAEENTYILLKILKESEK